MSKPRGMRPLLTCCEVTRPGDCPGCGQGRQRLKGRPYFVCENVCCVNYTVPEHQSAASVRVEREPKR